jgi:hypothetical protein
MPCHWWSAPEWTSPPACLIVVAVNYSGDMAMSLILIIVVLVLLFGGGGFYGHWRGYYGEGRRLPASLPLPVRVVAE